MIFHENRLPADDSHEIACLLLFLKKQQRGSCMVWEINMGVCCPRLEFDNNMLYYIVWGMTFLFMVHLSFYAIPLLIYDVMNDITIIP